MTPLSFRLDPDGEIPGDGETVLDTERSFLENMVSGRIARRFLVHGRTLCSWVEEWCRGRAISAEYIRSPKTSWRYWHPQWTDDEITYLQQKSRLLSAPDTFDELLPSLFTDAPFFGSIGTVHAAEWAMWLTRESITSDASVCPLLKFHATRWRDSIEEKDLLLQTAYRLDHSEAARGFLQDWLLEGRFGVPFPLPIPDDWKQKAQLQWQFQLLEIGCVAFWRPIAAGNYSSELRKVAAKLVYNYLKHNPEQINSNELISLKPYLTGLEWKELSQASPPEPPRPVRIEAFPEQVLQWFVKEYLPFREWQLAFGSQTTLSDIAPVAKSFADWVLNFYPQAVGGGAGYDHLAIAASARLQQAQGVVLWIILDGLPVPDGNRLHELLATEKRLTKAENRLCFTCLPTITCFCKPALMNGCPPETQDITETPLPKFGNAVILRDKTMRDQAASAQSGQILVWSHKEPDSTYHRNQSRETTLAEVDSQLSLIAARIKELTLAVPDHLPVSVFVSTDHGRVLSTDIERAHTLPSGATSEGRAAWSHSGVAATPSSEVVVLTAEKYRLPDQVTAWVARDAGAFTMSNGTTGKVSFPHGGLWPEEVIVPWFSFVRDAKQPALRIIIMGNGRTGGSGTFIVTLTNAESVPVTITGLTIRDGEGRLVWSVPSLMTCPPQQQRELSFEIVDYPNVDSLIGFVGEATVVLPNGVLFLNPAEVALKTDSLYSRGLDAQDLLDL